jgi:hypothetical protein
MVSQVSVCGHLPHGCGLVVGQNIMVGEYGREKFSPHVDWEARRERVRKRGERRGGNV